MEHKKGSEARLNEVWVAVVNFGYELKLESQCYSTRSELRVALVGVDRG